MAYNILTDELPTYFDYYAVDYKFTDSECKFVMIPSKERGANISRVAENYVIAVYIVNGNAVLFKRIPGLVPMTINDVNELITTCMPVNLQVQIINDAVTGLPHKTKGYMSPTVNYTKPSVAQIVAAVPSKGTAPYHLNKFFRNSQRFNDRGLAIRETTQLQLTGVSDGSGSVFIQPIQYVEQTIDGVKQKVPKINFYTKNKKQVQASVTPISCTVNDYLRNADGVTPIVLEIPVSWKLSYVDAPPGLTDLDNVITKTMVIESHETHRCLIYQRDKYNKPIEGAYDVFGNRIHGIDGEKMFVSNTQFVLLTDKSGKPVKLDFSIVGGTMKGLKDVIG